MAEVRFYLDENVATPVAIGLRNHSIDVERNQDAGHSGWKDKDILAYTLQENRVVVTQDDDFLRLAAEISQHAGIVYYKDQSRTIKQIISGLVLIYGVLEDTDMQNHIEFL